MSIRLALRFLTVMLVVGSALAIADPVASAHGSGVIIVPRQLDGRPAMHLDGSCEADYHRSGNARTLLYRPGYDWPPASVSLITTATQLWVCVTGLSRRPNGSATAPYLSLVFDPDHSASSAPDSDDLAFAIDENNGLTEYHGNGVGFVPQPGLSGWSAMTQPAQEITWTAEYQISLAKIGNPGPGSVIGFQARHNALFSTNDYFPWPSDSTRNAPATWGDLFFLGATTTTPGFVQVEGERVTQGLEWDVAQGANKAYDFVAGKDAMMQGRLYTLGSVTDLTYSACRVQLISPTTGAAQVLPVEASLRPTIYPGPSGSSGSSGMFRCWVPGSMLRSIGVYRFSLVAQMSGGTRQTIDLGTRSTVPARAVRLMVYRWVFPTGHPENRAWDSTLNASAMGAMQDLQRVLPVSAGVGSFSFDSTPAADAAGLRYFFSPTVYQCVVGSEETMGQATGRCDATTRNNADLERMNYDNQSARADAADGRHRDRIDLQEVYVSTPNSGGGQSCWANSASAGSGLDSLADGQSHFVPIQESEHCWGQVRPTSPHSIPDNRAHSRNDFFSPAGGRPLINVQTHQEVPVARGVMSPFFYGGDDHNTFTNEGVEFNDLRTTLLGLRPPSGNAVRGSVRPQAAARQFQIAFLMDHTNSPDAITLQTAQRLDASTLAPTAAAPGSPFSLVFRAGDGSVVRRLPFAVTTEGTHDGPIPIEGQVLVSTLPATAASVDIEQKNNPEPLFSEKFTAAAPVVDSLSATPNGGNEVDLSWTGSDPDSSQLRYNVYFAQRPGALRTLIASGLTDPSYAFDTSFAPGTADGVLTVEATDGLNTGEASVGKIVISTKKPDVAIQSPGADATFVAGGSAQLAGAGYDPNTMSALDGKNLSWTLDGSTSLGTGTELTLADLTVGPHSLRLTGATPAGTTASRTIKITVLSDVDRDGIPTQAETAHPCLDAKVFDSDADADLDGLTSFAEWQLGTDPCNPDTDGDGTDDGDEVAHSSDPTSAKSVPLPAKIYLATESVRLGTCANPKPADIPVDQLKASPWTATADEPFVSVSGGGSGAGSVHVAPDCTGLASGHTYLAHVGVEASTGQYREVEVSFRS